MEKLPAQEGMPDQLMRISSEVIRFETFTKLGLTHTCNDGVPYGPSFKTDSDVDDIQAEEAQLILEHEELVSEFQEKYEDEGGTITSFLKGYWKARMKEVYRERPTMTVEEMDNLRELGVKLDKESDTDDDLDSDSDDSVVEFGYADTQFNVQL